MYQAIFHAVTLASSPGLFPALQCHSRQHWKAGNGPGDEAGVPQLLPCKYYRQAGYGYDRLYMHESMLRGSFNMAAQFLVSYKSTYRIAGKFGGELNLAVWWTAWATTKLKSTKISSLAYTVVSRKRAHNGLSAHPPVLPRFPAKAYSKEHPPSSSIANRDFPLSSKHGHVVRLVYTHYKVQIMLLHSGLH